MGTHKSDFVGFSCENAICIHVKTSTLGPHDKDFISATCLCHQGWVELPLQPGRWGSIRILSRSNGYKIPEERNFSEYLKTVSEFLLMLQCSLFNKMCTQKYSGNEGTKKGHPWCWDNRPLLRKTQVASLDTWEAFHPLLPDQCPWRLFGNTTKKRLQLSYHCKGHTQKCLERPEMNLRNCSLSDYGMGWTKVAFQIFSHQTKKIMFTMIGLSFCLEKYSFIYLFLLALRLDDQNLGPLQ